MNIWNNDFNGSYHADESKKTHFIAKNIQDFHHPILMLNVPRVLNIFFKFKKFDDILRLGRMTTAVFGTLLVLVFFLMARRFMDSPYDLLAAAALASSPIIVMHSHYLKEDMIFTFFAFLSLFSFSRVVHKPSCSRILFIGLSFGLALSSQYKGVLLLPVFLVGIIISDVKEKRRLFWGLIPVIVLSLIVFLLVNYPAVTDFPRFCKGFNFELNHIQRGHDLRIFPFNHFFSFHLLNSIVPGMTQLIATLAVLSLVYFIYRRATLNWEETIWLVFTLIFYFAVESTPMKAHPDHMRYVIPVVPGLIYFLFKLFERAMNHWNLQWAKIFPVTCIILTIIISLQTSIRLNYYLIRDTRNKAMHQIKTMGKKVLFERYSSEDKIKGLAVKHNLDKVKKDGVSYVVVSSFNYDRYQYGSTLKNQSRKVRKYNLAYQNLFQYPYVEIKPDYMTFAFSNPTIRIIDITGKKENR